MSPFIITGAVLAWLVANAAGQGTAAELNIKIVQEEGVSLDQQAASSRREQKHRQDQLLPSELPVARPLQAAADSADDALLSTWALGGLSAVIVTLCALVVVKLGWFRFVEDDGELPLLVSIPLAVVHHSPLNSPRSQSPCRVQIPKVSSSLSSSSSFHLSPNSPTKLRRPASPYHSANRNRENPLTAVISMFAATGTTTKPMFELDDCHCLKDGVKLCQDPDRLVYEGMEADANAPARLPLPQVSITTLNIHCPAHKRTSEGRESQDVGLFVPRNTRILEMLLEDPPTLVCLQEFWMCSSQILSLYQAALGPAGYSMYIAPRPKCRGDGLVTLVSTDRFDVLHHEAVSYEDCGDRVGQVLHLTGKGMGKGEGEMLLVNTHLMFQHDACAELIRLRQTAKLLSFLRRYTTEHNVTDVPIVICGDWNGEPDGAVARFMQSQGFMSAYDETSTGQRWVSHLNHHKEAVGVDYVWVLNPSAQKGGFNADWQRMVCDCLIGDLNTQGIHTPEDAFAFFDQKGQGFITAEDLQSGCERLHMMGEDGIGLLPGEVADIAQYMDGNGDGIIERQDFVRNVDMTLGIPLLNRLDGDIVEFVMTSNALRARDAGARSAPAPAVSNRDLVVVEASLPASFAAGVWPQGFEEEISDHAPLKAILSFPALEKQHHILELEPTTRTVSPPRRPSF